MSFLCTSARDLLSQLFSLLIPVRDLFHSVFLLTPLTTRLLFGAAKPPAGWSGRYARVRVNRSHGIPGVFPIASNSFRGGNV
jgi:hypothetical protein